MAVRSAIIHFCGRVVTDMQKQVIICASLQAWKYCSVNHASGHYFIHVFNISPFQTSSSSSSSCIGLPDPNCSLDNMEEMYTSSLFQTEPLYQFYDSDLKTGEVIA
jgi:hypothetical protein